MKNKVEYDGEEGGETGEPQRQKRGKLEVKTIGENANSGNIAITTVHLLDKLVK